MFDVFVQWEDRSVNLCNITDFWITKTIRVELKRRNDINLKWKIVKVRDNQHVDVQWENESFLKNTNLEELFWTNKADFYGCTLQWASDTSWVGTVLSDEGSSRKRKMTFIPGTHTKQTVLEKQHDESETSPENSPDSSSEGFKLLEKLSLRGIQCICTFQLYRFKGLDYPDDKTMKEQGRGTFVEKQGFCGATKISATKWYDNRPVHIASTYMSSLPPTEVKRWISEKGEEKMVSCPAVVPEYNSFMGQIDNIGRLLSLYRIKIDCRKRFYLKIFFHYCDLAVINSWLLYRRDSQRYSGTSKCMDLWEFKARVASSLCNVGKTQKKQACGRPRFSNVDALQFVKRMRGPAKAIPERDIRTDGFGHWPCFSENRGRCKYPQCKGLVSTKCEKCDVHLCFTKGKNCFRNFHLQ